MKPGYMPLDDAIKLDRAGIEQQMNVRREMARACVGWLYASILSDEIVTLDKAWRTAVQSGEQ